MKITRSYKNKNKNKTKKQKGGTIKLNILPQQKDETLITSILNFFNINDKEYFKNALYDATGLYSLLNWKNVDTIFTYDNDDLQIRLAKQNNLQLLNNNKDKPGDKFRIGGLYTPKYEQDSINEYELKNNLKNKKRKTEQYIYYGSFEKIVKADFTNITFRCQIFKNNFDGNIIITFRWGCRYDLTLPNISIVLDKMYEFIIEKLAIITTPISKILLFGFSMGGNVAHHIALRFFLNEYPYKDNIYITSLGSGGTIHKDSKYDFNKIFYGKFVSFAIAIHIQTEYEKIINTIESIEFQIRNLEHNLKTKKSVSEIEFIKKQIAIKNKKLAEHKTKYDEKFKGINDDKLNKQNSVEVTDTDLKTSVMNSYILPKQNFKTVKSLIINMNIISDPINKISFYKKGSTFIYDLQDIYIDDELSHLHKFKKYKAYIYMLINNNFNILYND